MVWLVGGVPIRCPCRDGTAGLFPCEEVITRRARRETLLRVAGIWFLSDQGCFWIMSRGFHTCYLVPITLLSLILFYFIGEPQIQGMLLLQLPVTLYQAPCHWHHLQLTKDNTGTAAHSVEQPKLRFLCLHPQTILVRNLLIKSSISWDSKIKVS